MKIRVKRGINIRSQKVDRIQEFIKDNGEMYSIAYRNKDKIQYKIVDRDSDGAIWQLISKQ